MKRVSDFIQKRVLSEQQIHEEQALKVKESFKNEIQESVALLSKEYASITPNPDTDMFQKSFLETINSKGLYLLIKDKLKSKIVDIVRDVYKKKSNFSTKAELQLFTTDLYVYLVDMMNDAIDQVPLHPLSVTRS